MDLHLERQSSQVGLLHVLVKVVQHIDYRARVKGEIIFNSHVERREVICEFFNGNFYGPIDLGLVATSNRLF